jgi:hypothetical protein
LIFISRVGISSYSKISELDFVWSKVCSLHLFLSVHCLILLQALACGAQLQENLYSTAQFTKAAHATSIWLAQFVSCSAEIPGLAWPYSFLRLRSLNSWRAAPSILVCVFSLQVLARIFGLLFLPPFVYLSFESFSVSCVGLLSL